MDYRAWRADLLAMYRAAIDAGDPERLTAAYLKGGGASLADAVHGADAEAPLLIAAAGKARRTCQ